MGIPFVSVCIITYNHENYIAQAIEGALIQKTNFPFEIVIGEDCSTDGTREIVFDYAKKYPNIIRVITSEKNVGMINNFIRTLNVCKGKYIALCEGDDYWTDPLKLQKQVDFLEANPGFVICFHNARKLVQATGDNSSLFFNNPPRDIFTLSDIIKNDFIPTLTCVFRSKLFKEFPDWYSNAYPGDWPLHILNAQHGKIKYIDEVMATYRLHEHGICTGNTPINNYEKSMSTLINIRDYLKFPYSIIMNNTISERFYSLAKLYALSNKKKLFLKSIAKSINFNPFSTFKLSYNPMLLFTRILFKLIKKEK